MAASVASLKKRVVLVLASRRPSLLRGAASTLEVSYFCCVWQSFPAQQSLPDSESSTSRLHFRWATVRAEALRADPLNKFKEGGLISYILLKHVAGEDLEEKVLTLHIDEDLVFDDSNIALLRHVPAKEGVQVDEAGPHYDLHYIVELVGSNGGALGELCLDLIPRNVERDCASEVAQTVLFSKVHDLGGVLIREKWLRKGMRKECVRY